MVTIQVVKGSMKFTPNGTGGGTLRWTERHDRKGFRPKFVEKSVEKQAHEAPTSTIEQTVA